MTNTLGLVICFAYVFAMIGLAEGLRRWRGYGASFTRKVIHIGVGMMSWFIPFLFTSPWPFVFACATFVVINLLDWRYGFFGAMQSSSRSNLGTVYFPLAAGGVALLFWEQPPLMVAALMPLTWGDGIAPVVGAAYGRRVYHVHTSTRTIEGSVGFFVAGFIFTWLALWLMPGQPAISPAAAVLPALVIMAVTTLIEAVSIWGLDNLAVTTAAVVILSLWPFGM
jgi:phytol kinase